LYLEIERAAARDRSGTWRVSSELAAQLRRVSVCLAALGIFRSAKELSEIACTLEDLREQPSPVITTADP
jgi:hypothetical protein